MKSKPHRQLESVRMTPYLCLTCGGIQLKHTEPGNCDRFGCEGNSIEKCGPRQLFTFAIESKFSDGAQFGPRQERKTR